MGKLLPKISDDKYIWIVRSVIITPIDAERNTSANRTPESAFEYVKRVFNEMKRDYNIRLIIERDIPPSVDVPITYYLRDITEHLITYAIWVERYIIND